MRSDSETEFCFDDFGVGDKRKETLLLSWILIGG